MSFWKTFGFHSISQIDTLLERDFTLEQLFDEEEILQETKSQNKKLIAFLVLPETLAKLLFYITKEPVEGSDNKRRLKFPLLSCEILSSEVFPIFDAFYQPENRSLLDGLYGFLDQPAPLNPLLASYTSRVAAILFQKKPAETLAYLKERTDVILNFIQHLGNASVMDLMLKIISHEDASENASTLEWLKQSNFIPSLVSKFDPSLPVEILENASQALVDIVAVSANTVNSPLIAQLESPELLETLFGYMLSSGLSQPLLHGVTVLIEVLRRHRREKNDDLTQLEELSTPLKLTIERLDKFLELLNIPSDAMVTLPGVGTIPPLGFFKLKIVDLFSMLVHSNYKCIDDELLKHNVISTMLDLFFAYHWNNFLHSTVEHMIQFVLQGQNEELKIKMLTDCKLVSRICEASKGNDEDCSKERGLRRGYMGFITLIAITITQLDNADTQIEQLLANDENWQKYVKGALAAIREKESRTLGGYARNEFHDDGLDDDFDQSPQQDFMTKRSFQLENDDSDDEDDDRPQDDDDDDDDEDDDNDDSDDDDSSEEDDVDGTLSDHMQNNMQMNANKFGDDDDVITDDGDSEHQQQQQQFQQQYGSDNNSNNNSTAAYVPPPVVLDFASFDGFLPAAGTETTTTDA